MNASLNGSIMLSIGGLFYVIALYAHCITLLQVPSYFFMFNYLRMKRKIPQFSEEQVTDETRSYLVKVYMWMSFALILTALIASWASVSPPVVEFIISSRWVMGGLFLMEFALVMILAGNIKNISSQTAILMFLLYSFLNGLTLSVIFLVFTTASIASTFFITAGTFLVMSLYGYFTKKDLTKMGSLLLMALVGLILASLVNMFFQDETIYWVTTFAGILIFTGLIAYDTQKIIALNVIGNEGTESDKKEAIMGALTLYLDFINLFLGFLRIFGKRK